MNRSTTENRTSMKLNGKHRPSKLFDSRKAALSWLELGILPVPLHAQSKKPKGEGGSKGAEGWNTMRVTADTIPQFFDDGDNIGGLWGEPSGWIVDVDLDWDEAVVAADILLPETFIYGRRSRPGSHYLYRVEGVSTFKRKPHGAEGSMIIEVRSTGSQSVLPPSIHPDGDRFEINNDVPFKSLTRRELERKVNLIASASLLARNYPESGGRHDFIHAVTGSLLWEGWKPEPVREFMTAVLDAADPKEDDRAQRDRTVENTIEHFNRGNRIAGWRTLSQWMSGEHLKNVRTWLDAGKLSTPPPIRIVSNKEREEVTFPAELLEVPGLVGEIMAWSKARSFTRQPIFDLAVGLASVALISGNRYVVEGWETPLQPYFLLLAPTASGKESALDGLHTIAKRANMGKAVFQGFQSHHALLDQLSEVPHIACWLWDEAARKLRTAGRSQGGQDYQIVTYLLSLYGKASSSVPGMPGRKSKIESIEYPFLSILAAAQPTQMIEAITESDLSMGLINRFVLFDAGDGLPETNLERSTVFPSRLEEGINEYRDVHPPKGDFPFVKVRMESTEAWAIFRDFNERSRQLSIKGGGWEMWGRANQNALILAGTVAIGINPKRPIITEPIARWAVSFLDWSSNRWVARVEECSSRSSIEIASKALERIIRHAETYKGRTRGREVESRAIERGLMPRSLLTRLSRHLRGRDLEDALQQLIQSDLIVAGESEGVEVYWIKS
jgi:hypothetical protein